MPSPSQAARARYRTESEMISLCEVTRTSNEMSEPDPVTGIESPIVEVIYTGICKWKAGGTAASEVAIPGMVVVEQDDELHFPVDKSANIRVNDVAVLLENPLDESMVGVKTRIKAPHGGSFLTARRFPIERAS